MPKYSIHTDWFGYSRGYAIYEVEAESKEEAEDKFTDGEAYLIDRGITRDDTEDKITDIVEESK